MRFLIRHPDAGERELTDQHGFKDPVGYFLDEYEGKGWEVVTSPPSGYDVPDIRAAKAERRETERAAKAKPETPSTTTTPAPKKD